MSIAILTQVYDEMRRLAIAGSAVAAGDFRLKKLIPPLEQAATKAPVFGKVADAVKAVIESNEKTAADALLELTALVNAILYTQGETGLEGPAKEIETTDLGVPSAQASSRVLKPLLEALTSTGSGRLELIRDAHERGAFRDLRLVKPALDAIDDVYGEIGDLIADKVLPIYGKAIVPELRAKLDLKGKGGHARRILLLHKLDPAGARELVKQALDGGSKEVKIAAIECLGGDEADLSYLLEQAAAKAQDVRQAAYTALAALDADEAVAVLQKALAGKDLELNLASRALRDCQNPKVLDALLGEGRRGLDEVLKTKDKKEVSNRINRLQTMLGCLARRQDKKSEAALLDFFGKRGDIAKLKGNVASGTDLNHTVVYIMSEGSKKLQAVLAEAHADLDAEELGSSFEAARRALPAAKVFETFAPYLTAKVDEKKKGRDPAFARREAILSALGADTYYWRPENSDSAPLDPRWLDAAVEIKHLGLIRALGRPGHAGANKLLEATFAEVLKKSKSLDDCHEVVASMVHASHPKATDSFIAAFEKHAKKADHYLYWFGRLIQELPKTAVPRLEQLVTKVGDKAADALIDHIHALREK